MGDTYQPRPSAGGASAPTTTSLLKGDGSGGIAAATANTDFVAPSAIGTSVASLSGTGNTVPRNQLPNISGAYWQTVANQAAMLALTAPDADTLLVVYRQDQPGYIWYLNPGLAPATLSNWQNVQEDAAGAAAAVQTNLNAEITRAQNAEGLLAPINSPSFTGTVKFPDGVVTQASTGQLLFGTSSNTHYLYSGTNGLIVNNQANTATLFTLSNAGALTLTGAASVGSLNITAATNPAVNYGGSLFLTRTAAGTVSVGSTLGGTDGTVIAATGTFSGVTTGSVGWSASGFSFGAFGITLTGTFPDLSGRSATFNGNLITGGNITAGGNITEYGTTASIPGVLKTVSINASAVANTALYTVPTGKTCVVTGYVVRVTAATAITNGPAAGLGNAAGTNNIAASQAMNGLTSTATTGSTSEFSWPIVGMTTVTPAAGVIYFNLGTAATGTSETIAVDLIGYLF